MAELIPGSDSPLSEQPLQPNEALVVAHAEKLSGSVDRLIDSPGVGEEVFGVANWRAPLDGPPRYTVFNAHRNGINNDITYRLRTHSTNSPSGGDGYVGLMWSKVGGVIDPENVQLERHEQGMWRPSQAGPQETGPFLTLDLDNTKVKLFDPDIHRVKVLSSGELTIVRRSRIGQAARFLGRVMLPSLRR